MAELVYCGTDPPVSAAATQQLLLGPFGAIWCPPGMLRQHQLAARDRIWLLWRSPETEVPLLLGGGRVAVTENNQLLWTNASLPGVRGAARDLGYGGPTNMAFLHLTGIVIPADNYSPARIGAILSGLNSASLKQVEVLTRLLAIP